MQYTLKYSKVFWTLSFFSIFSLLIFLIFQINYFTQEVFALENNKKKLDRLSEDKEILEINLAKSSSLGNIESYLRDRSFEKAEKIKYIRILESSVVKKR